MSLRASGSNERKAMEIVALIILSISIAIGVTAIFFTTFGTLIILTGSAAYALLTGFAVITIKHLVILLILYLCGETLEYLFIIIGTKKFGASNAAVAAALIGGIAGAILGTTVFGVGLFAGTFLGIFLGAFLVELFIRRDLQKSLKAGAGGVLGRFGSIIAKLIIAAMMISVLASRVLRRLT